MPLGSLNEYQKAKICDWENVKEDKEIVNKLGKLKCSTRLQQPRKEIKELLTI